MTGPNLFGTMGVTHNRSGLIAGRLRAAARSRDPRRRDQEVLVPINQMVGDPPQGPRESAVRPSTGNDLVQVVAQARAGTNEAWETLIERFGGLVAAIARRCRLSDADVAEVCQTTWMRLVENLDRIEQPERLGAWLATTSRRESIRIASRHAAISATEAVSLMADDEADPLDAAILREEQVESDTNGRRTTVAALSASPWLVDGR